MKIFFTLSLLFTVCAVEAQELLSPLRYNSTLTSKKSLEKEGAIHEQFIYLFDTLSLPFIDDFSQNHFKTFNAQATDTNVTDTTWFRLENAGSPSPWGVNYITDTTFTISLDTIAGFGFDSIVEISRVPFPSTMVTVNDIDNYPVVSTLTEVWPGYDVYDSLWNGTSPDDTIFASPPDFEQDSSKLYFAFETAADTNVFWQDIRAYHNYTFAENPQTLGVVSFDGLDENGYPYDFTTTTAYGEADVLTSKPIDMSGVTLADSAYFSFLSQPKGLSDDDPDTEDSLVLEFWSPQTNQWNWIWSKLGGTSSEPFKMTLLKLTDPMYFQNGFQFRFKNYGTLTGSLDAWHIDYVHLDVLRAHDDVRTDDWAFSHPAPSLIKDYTAMPWPHYEYDPVTPVKSSTSVSTYNSYSNSIFVQPCSMDLFYNNNLLINVPYSITTVNVSGTSSFDMDYTLPAAFEFDTAQADTCATFYNRYYLATNTISDLEVNDILWQAQHFSNYYAYDDGTAEVAYGVVGAGSELAYKFAMPSGLTDTLRAIDIHFSPSVHDRSNHLFFLQIWDDQGGEPGNLIYTSDDQNLPITFTPEYNLGTNGFFEYELPEKIVVSGVYYVGWKQSSADYLNIGFDKNINNQNKIFYKTASTWRNTLFEGSLMMRPVFTSDKDYILSLLEQRKDKDWEVNVYPNPSSDMINIDIGDVREASCELFDIQGKSVLQSSLYNTTSIDIRNLPTGIYMLKATDDQNRSVVRKVSIAR